MSNQLRRQYQSAVVLAIISLLFFFASAAQAATFHVTTTADNGDNNNPTPGSLRKAIIDANAFAGTDTIDFNIAGAGVQTISPPSPLPTITDPVVIDGYTQPGASANTLTNGDNAMLLIELDGTNIPAGTVGLSITAGGSTIRGLVINRFSKVNPQTSGAIGIALSSKGGNSIAGNFIGTDASGKVKTGNYEGVVIDGCGNNTIGGTTPAARNIISGNINRGILITHLNALNNQVQGNFIGTDITGTTDISNFTGVSVEATGLPPTNTVIGGTAAGAGNVISGSRNWGIYLGTAGVTVQGNLIGTDITGKAALPNNIGINIITGTGITIGGTTPAARNVISGNSDTGIELFSFSSGATIQGNYIGTDITGNAPLGNSFVGIFSAGSNMTIGGTVAGAGNTIAYNGSNGILVSGLGATTGDTIEGNSIYSNGALGIDLAPVGVTPNDPGDADGGINNLQNYPVITSALLSAGATAVNGTLNSTANTQFRVEFFANTSCDPSTFGQGQTFLGATSVTTSGSGDANLVQTFGGLSAGQFITATATDPAGNTSEFSQCRQITTPGSSVTLQFSASNYSVGEKGGSATITVTRTGGNAGAVSVQYSTLDGTATAGSDYTAASGTLNWADGDAASKTFVIAVADDALNETNETINLTLTNPTGGATLGSQSSAALTIIDDDPMPTLSINDVSQTEGDSGTTNFNFTVSLSAPSGQIVRVDFTTADGTAQANSDYQFNSGNLVIPPGQASRQITVRVNGDTQFEPDENFFLNLSNPTAASIAKAQGTGTILNDDAPPPTSTVQIEHSSYTVSEGDHFKLINITRTGDTSTDVTVDYATSDGTAQQRTDYTLMLGRLHFAPGETTKTLTLLVTEDSYAEGDETLTLSLSNPAGAALGGQSQAQVTILDNDTSQNAQNAILDVQNFVRQQYHDFLNREPDPPGFAGWQNILNNCPQSGKDAQGNYCDRIEVSSAFYRSQEFHDRGYFIYRFYSASLGRTPQYQEFMRDMQKVSGFLSAQQEEQAKVDFINEFMARSEFQQKYGQITDPGAYVDMLSTMAGVNLSTRNLIVSQLQGNQITRGQALRAVIESAEVDQHFYNQGFVVMQYFGYLRRDPDILYQQWIQTFNQSNDYRILVNGFVNSLEYVLRFGQ